MLCIVLVGTLVTAAAATDISQIKYCIRNCPMASDLTAVCGLRKNSATDFEYTNFISICGLNNANCGVADPAKRKLWSLTYTYIPSSNSCIVFFKVYTAISQVGVSCAQLAMTLPRKSILPAPAIETAVPANA